jgi:hypothetical protein
VGEAEFRVLRDEVILSDAVFKTAHELRKLATAGDELIS